MSTWRVSPVVILLGGLVWAAFHFGATPADQRADGDRGAPATGVIGPSDAGPVLAARYHLRTRTQRFYQRSAPRPQAAPAVPACPPGDAPRPGATEGGEKDKATVRSDTDKVAARYHLRTRTSRFFGRAAS